MSAAVAPPVFILDGKRRVSMAGAGRMLGVSKQRVHELVKTKRLRARRLRGSEMRLILVADVRAFKRRRAGRPKTATLPKEKENGLAGLQAR